MSTSDRPSQPDPLTTPVEGYVRPGIVYVDDSETSLRTMRRALYPHGLLLETFASLESLRGRGALPIVGALLDFDLGGGETGADVARAILAEHPAAIVAFFTSDAGGDRAAELAALGPVFRKDRDLARAVAWLVAVAKPAAPAGAEGIG